MSDVPPTGSPLRFAATTARPAAPSHGAAHVAERRDHRDDAGHAAVDRMGGRADRRWRPHRDRWRVRRRGGDRAGGAAGRDLLRGCRCHQQSGLRGDRDRPALPALPPLPGRRPAGAGLTADRRPCLARQHRPGPDRAVLRQPAWPRPSERRHDGARRRDHVLARTAARTARARAATGRRRDPGHLHAPGRAEAARGPPRDGGAHDVAPGDSRRGGDRARLRTRVRAARALRPRRRASAGRLAGRQPDGRSLADRGRHAPARRFGAGGDRRWAIGDLRGPFGRRLLGLLHVRRDAGSLGAGGRPDARRRRSRRSPV